MRRQAKARSTSNRIAVSLLDYTANMVAPWAELALSATVRTSAIRLERTEGATSSAWARMFGNGFPHLLLSAPFSPFHPALTSP
jgi:hypothetical protein